jgi:fucose 4-O-acetylase-like acetyltransferase
MTRRFLQLNGLAIIGAVAYHATGWGYVAMFWWTHRYRGVTPPNFDQMGSAAYYGLRTIEQLIAFGVPAFLFVSGYFAAFAGGRSSGSVGWGFVARRIRSLAIPYVLWSMAMMAIEALEGRTYSPLGFLRTIAFGEATPAFYFVPLLCQLYLLSPLLIPWARTKWKALLLGTAILQTAVHIARYGAILGAGGMGSEVFSAISPGWFFPGNIFWFSLGAVVGYHQREAAEFLARFRKLWIGGVVALLPLGILEWEALLRRSGEVWLTPKETVVDNLYALMFILAFLSLVSLEHPLSKPTSDLGARSYGIYLVHPLALTLAARATYHLAPWMLGVQLLFQPLLLAAGLGIPLLLMAVVRRSPARWSYQFQFG